MSPMTVVLIPSVFSAPGRDGDFSWMVRQPRWANTLFVFNDNESQSQAFLADVASGAVSPTSAACQAGGGNAVVRPFQCRQPPRAAGVPTGPGYASLTEHAGRWIDAAIAHIDAVLASGEYAEVVYSASRTDPSVLGHGIFEVGDEVLRYIPARLAQVVARINGC
mgnify:CR=1 FL=1